MHTVGFPAHFRQHLPVYLLIFCFSFVLALTLFQLTAPRSTEPKLLLIDDGGALPDIETDASVRYAAAETSLSPDLVQTYVLMTGGGNFSVFCAPIARMEELYMQELIRPLTVSAENMLFLNGMLLGIPVNEDYALFAFRMSDESAEQKLLSAAGLLP